MNPKIIGNLLQSITMLHMGSVDELISFSLLIFF